jgi:uncharacterized protein DUF3883
MSASSDTRLDILGRLETKQVQFFLRVLSHSTMRRSQFIGAIYGEQARNFRETLQFLKNINWVREQQDELLLTNDGDSAGREAQNDAEIRKRLLQAMISEDSPYKELLADYLTQFKLTETGLVHRPPISDRLDDSGLRNLLIDMRVVTYRAADDVYALEEVGLELYVWAKDLQRPTSRKKFEADVRQKEELGYSAELAVLEYEKNRVGVEWASKVEHVSGRLPFACYDIKSVTLHDGRAVPRYIEVKAVAADSRQFYWTASEVEAARLLRAKYFLYLLPVVAGATFDLTRMMVVEDAYNSVYQNAQGWLIEENVIVCRQRRWP